MFKCQQGNGHRVVDCFGNMQNVVTEGLNMLGVATNVIQGNAIAHASNDFHSGDDVSEFSLRISVMIFINCSGEFLHEASSFEFNSSLNDPSSYSQMIQGATYPDVAVTDTGASFR